jgi:hypothetical protein
VLQRAAEERLETLKYPVPEDPRLSVGEGIELARRFKAEVMSHMSHFPETHVAHIGLRTAEESSA